VPSRQDYEGLFQVTPVEPLVVECRPVGKVFRTFQPDQLFLVPPSLDEWLPQEHLARYIADVVDEHLDLSGFYAGYKEGRAAVRSAVDGAGAVDGLHDRDPSAPVVRPRPISASTR
jgi:hypothetical protein